MHERISIAQADLECTIQLSVILDQWQFSCLSLLKAGITGISHHTQFSRLKKVFRYL